MAYKYRLPAGNGNVTEYEVVSNSVIIIGANGSGKSKLGAWIEKNDFQIPIALVRRDLWNLEIILNR